MCKMTHMRSQRVDVLNKYQIGHKIFHQSLQATSANIDLSASAIKTDVSHLHFWCFFSLDLFFMFCFAFVLLHWDFSPCFLSEL